MFSKCFDSIPLELKISPDLTSIASSGVLVVTNDWSSLWSPVLYLKKRQNTIFLALHSLHETSITHSVNFLLSGG